MSVEANTEIPFISSDQFVGESKYRTVNGYPNQVLVTKVDKQVNPYHQFNTAQEAIEDIESHKQERQIIVAMAKDYGISGKQLPVSRYVIHNHPSGRITYTEIQQWYKESKTLYELGPGVSNLPDQTLSELRNLFMMNLAIWRRNRMAIDLVGSSNRDFSGSAKVLRRIFPLFFSENVVIDGGNKPVLVDGGLHKAENYKKRIWDELRVKSEIFGTNVSILTLNLVLAKRKIAQAIRPLKAKSEAEIKPQILPNEALDF